MANKCQQCGDYEPAYLCNAMHFTRAMGDMRFMLCQECVDKLFAPKTEPLLRTYFFCEEGTRLSLVRTSRLEDRPPYYRILYAANSRDGLHRTEPDHIPVFADIDTLKQWWLKRGVVTGSTVALDPVIYDQYEEGHLYYFHKEV
jgi:hypothetical protein